MGSAVEFTKEYDEYLLILQMSTSAVTVKRVLFYMKLCHLTKHRESPEENIQVQLSHQQLNYENKRYIVTFMILKMSFVLHLRI